METRQGVRHTWRKLTPAQVNEIRTHVAARKKLLDRAEYYGMHRTFLSKLELLTQEEILELHQMSTNCMSFRQIALKFKINPSTVAQISRGDIWKNK